MTVTRLPSADLGQPEQDVKAPEPDDERHWSVTTIIKQGGGSGDSNALIGWAAKMAAECGIKQVDTWRSIEQSSGTIEAARWVAAARFRPPKGEKTAAELGSAVHEACETYALTGDRPHVTADVLPFLDQFDRFLQEWTPRFRATEVCVYSTRYRYAGTADVFLEVEDPSTGQWVTLIADYKTTREANDARGRPKTPFAEVALQLAAYRFAEMAAVWRPRRWEHFRRRYYLLGPNEKANAVPIPEVDGGACIHITPEACNLFPVRCDEEVFNAFLYVREVARFNLQLAPSVIGLPMVRPPKEMREQ